MRKINLIVIHCSATTKQQDIGANEIRQWHLDRNWDDIGYHYVIRRNGVIEKGRNEEIIGAHAKGYNNHSIGVCLVGGVDGYNDPEDNFTDHQMTALSGLLYNLKKQYPQARVVRHNQLNHRKDCPCFDLDRIPPYDSPETLPTIKEQLIEAFEEYQEKVKYILNEGN